MKKYFLAGILVWAPLAITIWVITWAMGILDGVFGSVMHVLITVLPSNLTQSLVHFRETPFIGVLIVIAAITLTGMFAITIAGRWLFRMWEKVLHRIPIVRSIYSSVKQVSDTLLSSSGDAKNLLYTGITRGKKLVIVVGSKKAIMMAIQNQEVELRHSGLRQMTSEVLPSLKEVL